MNKKCSNHVNGNVWESECCHNETVNDRHAFLLYGFQLYWDSHHQEEKEGNKQTFGEEKRLWMAEFIGL